MARDTTISPDYLGHLRKISNDFVNDSNKVDASHASTFDWLAAKMHEINFGIYRAQESGISDEQILDVLQEVRKIQAQSPFVDRLQNWYRGYPGDFETVEYLMESQYGADPNTIGFWVERYCLNTAIAQQHRNKVGFQADRILQAVIDGIYTGRPARILSLACGSSPDIRAILDLIEPLEFEICLNDMDKEALEFSENKLTPIADRLRLIHGNAIRHIKKLSEHGKFDLVLAGGLFDYLNEDFAVFLTKNVFEKLLTADGRFVFTNIANPNPYKYWMEYCANWKLIERGEADIRRIIETAGFDRKGLSMRKDATDLTHLIEIRKNPAV